ncbi:unnamed protein product [Brugia timori]|uniref:ShKT domain-containing protein n=1 Tax=Brugia timori TaxID=42155 RepID=A0A0R3QAF0_9BILA|nr:unnamed protein product [Brugia timori]
MDCNIEKDEFSITNCSHWADAGYCLSNNATRFLWCRKTCLSSSSFLTSSSLSTFSSLFVTEESSTVKP